MGHVAHGDGSRRHAALAEPSQVGRNHPVAIREGVDLPSPHRVIERESMDQQNRWPVALVDESKTVVMDGEVVHDEGRGMGDEGWGTG